MKLEDVTRKLEDTVPKVTEILTPTAGSGTALGIFVGWLNEYGVAIGLLLTTASFITNSYYRFRKNKREQIEHVIRIKANGYTEK